MKIFKPVKIVELSTGLHQCPGCLRWNLSNRMREVPWRRVKLGPSTKTIEFCASCYGKRHDEETGERLMYRMREICLGLNIAKNDGVL